MIAALLTTFLFAGAVSLARHSVRYLGSQRANLTRQILALFFLGLWANTFGQGLQGPVLGYLFCSGVIGFGVGDWALYEALPRIGPGLTILLAQCLAAPIGAVTEWLWLGTAISPLQLGGAVLVLLGVGVAVSPEGKAKYNGWGIFLGVFAGLGQAWGAVLSRQAFLIAGREHFHLDGLTSAYQRLWGGLTFGLILLLLRKVHSGVANTPNSSPPANWREGWKWALANGLCGAVLGVGCYQWALQTTPSAIVLPIVSMTPLVVMIGGVFFDRQWPRPRVLLGALLAVSGVMALVCLR